MVSIGSVHEFQHAREDGKGNKRETKSGQKHFVVASVFGAGAGDQHQNWE